MKLDVFHVTNISVPSGSVGEGGSSSALPQSRRSVTTWIYRPRAPVAVSLSAGGGAIASGRPPFRGFIGRLGGAEG